jgi:HlyD family secretion protein
MKLTRRRATYAAVSLGAIALVAFALRPQPVEADFVEVTKGPMLVTIDEEGETRVRNRFVLSAPLPGRMRRIELEPGDAVLPNKTVIATFQPADPTLLDARTRTELEARVRAARAVLQRVRAELERARSQLGFAEAELKRYQELVAAGVAPKDRLESAEVTARTQSDAVRAAEFAVVTAEHELEVAQAGLLQTRGGGSAAIELRSPIEGVVLRRLRESEAVVPAGEPLMEIGNLDDLEIVSDLLSADAARVEPGQRVIIDRWGGEGTLAGTVRRVEPSGFTKISALGVEEQRVNVIIDVASADRQRARLGDGYRVEVRIVIWEKDQVLKIPTSSLFRQEERWAVYRVEENRARERPVELGQRTSLEAEVLSGLEAGDRIIAYPSDAVTDGVQVVPR